MLNILNLNKKSFLYQFVAILIVIIVFSFSKPQYVSTVTVNPSFERETIISRNGITLSTPYTQDHTFNLFLEELANDEARSEIWNNYLSKNQSDCNVEPKLQFYAKTDNSFPVTGRVMAITVKSNCNSFVKDFIVFLVNDLNKRLIDRVQKIENDFLEHSRENLIKIYDNEVSDLEIYIADRKEILQKIIPLLTEEINLEIQPISLVWSSRYDIAIPTTSVAAQAELDFLSSITDLSTISRGLVEQTTLIERHRVQNDFSNSILVKASEAGPERISKTNLYLSIFFILMILGLGFVNMLLTKYKYHRNNP